MLKPRAGSCIDCPPGSPHRFLTAGRCSSHYWAHRRMIATQKKARAKIVSGVRVDILELWFAFHTARNSWICENCAEVLNPISPFYRKSFQAHILPKSDFPSVKGVLENHMLLGRLSQPCDCHGQYDSSWQNAQAMPVFKIAIDRFNTFKHLILPQELKKLPAVFRDLI